MGQKRNQNHYIFRERMSGKESGGRLRLFPPQNIKILYGVSRIGISQR